MELIELFSGIGTQAYSFQQYINTNVLGISEIDNRPLKAYKAIFNKMPYNFGDIRKIEKLPPADIWTYSFPCTDLSIAGKKAGLQGKYSGLLYEVQRLLQKSPLPKILIMENVANLASAKFLPDFNQWLDFLSSLGYITTWEKIQANHYGGGTIRKRIFAISILDKKFIFPEKTGTKKVVLDYLEDPVTEYCVDDSLFLYQESKKNYNTSIKLQDYKNGGQGNRIYSVYGQGVTLTATGGGKAGSSGGLYARPQGIYKLTPREMMLISGWTEPEISKVEKVLSPREIGFVMGNSIDLTVMKKIAKEVISYL